MALPNSSVLSTYGASAKVNYQNLPPSDQTVSWDNTKLAPAIGDVAGLTLTAPRFICQFTLANSTGSLVLNNWFSVWKNATPTTPILTRTGTGLFTITLPVNVSDEYTQSVGTPSVIPVSLTTPLSAVFANGGAFGFVNVGCTANVVLISTANTSGTASDLIGNVLTVSVR